MTSPETKEPNGAIKRAGSLLTVHAIAFRIQANLLADQWEEMYMAAGYVLNHTLTRSLN